MTHIKVNTKVMIKNYSPSYNGLIGVVVDRDGEYYQVETSIQDELITLYDLYRCELEVLLGNFGERYNVLR